MKTIVVGAGIAGLATAWALAKSGHEVVVLEQGTIPNTRSASGDHHRIIRRAYGSHLGYARQIDEAYAAWDELWRDLGQSHHDPRGFLCLSYREGDSTDGHRAGLQAGGFPFDIVEPDEAVARWPFLERQGMRYALHSREGGILHCRRIAAGLVEWLRASGADVRENCRAASIDAEAGTVTLADGQTLTADRLVITAGAWTLALVPALAGELKPWRTAVAYVSPPADLADAWAAAPAILDVGRDGEGYIVPPSGGGGLKFGTGLHKRPTDDPDADRDIADGECERIRARMAPGIARLDDYRIESGWSCVYTFTQDDAFHGTRIGKALVVSACSGHGYKFGAAVGRRVAEAVETGHDAALRRWLRAEQPA